MTIVERNFIWPLWNINNSVLDAKMLIWPTLHGTFAEWALLSFDKPYIKENHSLLFYTISSTYIGKSKMLYCLGGIIVRADVCSYLLKMFYYFMEK